MTKRAQDVARWVLAAGLLWAGLSHLGWQREEFQAQVPSWLDVDKDLVVLASGVAEITLGLALLVWRERRTAVGWATAAFFVLIFPGNIAQYVEQTDAFGLDSDQARAARLAFQPVLVAWALWCTGAWSAWPAGRSRARPER
ncbi:MAG: hypothetical protein WCA29_11230 [Jiangellales bacterium]